MAGYDLGEAAYRSLAHRGAKPGSEPQDFAGAVAWFVRLAGGSVSAAARLAGVPRRTFRDWVGGSAPRDPGRRSAIFRAALSGERRRRMPASREARLKQLDVSNVVLKGRYNYDAGTDEQAMRTVEIGRYMADDAITTMVDAFLAGADVDELRQVFADSITEDPTGFYADTMALPQTDEHGWTVANVWWEGDPGR